MNEEYYKKLHNFPPNAVACMRGNIRTSVSYDAEVSQGGVHRLISQGCSSHDEAKEMAQRVVDKVWAAMQKAADEILSKYPVAEE